MHFQGLFYTGGKSADFAAAWVFENENDPSLNEPLWVIISMCASK